MRSWYTNGNVDILVAVQIPADKNWSHTYGFNFTICR